MNENRNEMPPQHILDAMSEQLQAKNREIIARVQANIDKGTTEESAVLFELAILAMQLENLTAIVLATQEDQPLIEVPRIGITDIKNG